MVELDRDQRYLKNIQNRESKKADEDESDV